MIKVELGTSTVANIINRKLKPVAVVVNIFGVFSEFGHRQFDFFVAIFINVVYQFGLKELGKVDGN